MTESEDQVELVELTDISRIATINAVIHVSLISYYQNCVDYSRLTYIEEEVDNKTDEKILVHSAGKAINEHNRYVTRVVYTYKGTKYTYDSLYIPKVYHF